MTFSNRKHLPQEGSNLQFKRPKLYRLRQIWGEYQWQIGLILLAGSLTLGYIGFAKYARAIGAQLSSTDLFYLTLQLMTLESGAVSGPVSWELEVARLLVPLATAYTALLGIAILFRKQLQMIQLWYIRDHVVICGLGEKGALLGASFRHRGAKVVLIEKDKGNPNIDLYRENGVIVVEGDATEILILKKAAAQRAKFLISVCGDDGINAEVAMSARNISRLRRRGALLCSIHILNPQLCELLREGQFGSETFPKFRLEMFNIFDLGARALLASYFETGRSADNGHGLTHLLVVGLGRLGETMIIQAARSWYEAGHPGKPLFKISIIDLAAKARIETLHHRYPKLADTCTLVAYEFDTDDSQFQQAEFLFNQKGVCELTSIFILCEDQTKALEAALTLRQRLSSDLPRIVVRMEEDSGLARLLTTDRETASSFHNVIPFGLLQQTCTPDLVLGGTQEVLARTVHTDYLRSRIKEGIKMGSTRAMARWEDLPGDLQESNRRQVDHIRLKLNAAGYDIQPLTDWEAPNYEFDPAEIELMAQLEHRHWVEERERNGWRFAPGEENPKVKTHPDLLPWNQLPEQVKDKDRQPAMRLPRLLAKGGFQVYCLSQDIKTRSESDGT